MARPAGSATTAKQEHGQLHGGYIVLRAAELCMAWTLLRQGALRLVDVRLWLACLEVRERRKTLARGRSARYGLRELQGLVGGGAGTLKGALRRLQRTGLMQWNSTEGPTFSCSPEQVANLDLELFWEMAGAMPSKRRRIPVPRRSVRLLAGGVNRSVLATALGQLVWCLYYHRRSGWKPEGSCKGSWIAETFGLSERSVTRARAHLEGLGWLRRVERQQWHQNRYGATYSVNLEWARTAGELSTTLERKKLSTTRMSPLPGQNGTGMSGPDSDQTPLREKANNQTPTSGGGPQSGVSSEDQKIGKPRLRDIKREDLSSIERLMALFDQALGLGVVGGDSFMERLNFAALAEHCRVRGTSNPPGMFSRLLRWGRTPGGEARKPSPAWHFVTEGDEEAVRVKLTAHLNGDPELLEPRRSGEGGGWETQERTPKRLSKDAAALRAIEDAVLRGRVRTSRASLQEELVAHGWTEERYADARRELTAWKRGEGDEVEYDCFDAGALCV